MKKLYIIDAPGYLFRSYYAIRGMTNAEGLSTNALFGFIRSIEKLLSDFSCEYIAVVFDGPNNKASRKELYEAYKAHRTGMPEDLVYQLDFAKQYCEAKGLRHFQIEGVEADDVIGTIAVWAKHHHMEVRICSTDKDLCQLVDSSVHCINTFKENLEIDRDMVKELYGVFPEQITDYLALVGDSSDNIPGVSGCGPKSAAAFLENYTTLENLFSHIDEISGKKGEMLKEGKESALLSKKLATIDTALSLPLSEETLTKNKENTQALIDLYSKMQFHTFIKELRPDSESIKQVSSSKTYTLISTREHLERFVKTLSYGPVVFDTETTSESPMRAELVGIGFSHQEGSGVYIPCALFDKGYLYPILSSLFTHPDYQWIAHNGKYDLHVLTNEGIKLPTLYFDTMIASYLLDPHMNRHNLDDLSLRHFGYTKIPITNLIGKGKSSISMREVPVEKVCEYCCEDVDYTYRLYTLFAPLLQKHGLQSLFTTVEIPLLSVLYKMERHGIAVDRQMLAEYSVTLQKKILELQKEIFSIAGEEFNINSPKQLSSILFEKLAIPSPTKELSTRAEVLEELSEYPIGALLLEYRSLEKLRSTYLEALPEEINPKTGKIHCSFHQTVAATGRLASSNPNLQNIPIRSEEGRKIREAFHPDSKGSSFVAADYSQIELRLLAHFSQDRKLVEAFTSGQDVHAITASHVFHIPLEEVTSEMRSRAKAVNFGIIYGQGAFGLSKQLKIDMKEAKEFIDAYFRTYADVKKYLESCKEFARVHGYSETLLGRKRPIPEITSKNGPLRSAAERLAVNTPLQGSQADIIKLAMIELDRTLPEAAMILQIHDELIFEVPDHLITKAESHIRSVMETIYPLSVPLTVNIAVGKNWGAC